MAPARSTAANQALQDEVISLGGSRPSDFQLRRWAETRVLPAPKPRGAGQGRGTTSAYPPGAAARAMRIMRLIDEGVPLRFMAAALFAQGETVEDAVLRRSLIALLDETIEVPYDVAGSGAGIDNCDDTDELLDIADEATRTATKRRRRPRLLVMLNRNLRAARSSGRLPSELEEGRQRGFLQATVLSMLTVMWAGEAVDSQALRQLLAAFGATEDLPEEILNTFGRRLEEMSLPEAKKNLARCSYENLCQARRSMDAALKRVGQFVPGLDVDIRALLGSQLLPLLLVMFLAPSLQSFADLLD